MVSIWFPYGGQLRTFYLLNNNLIVNAGGRDGEHSQMSGMLPLMSQHNMSVGPVLFLL